MQKRWLLAVGMAFFFRASLGAFGQMATEDDYGREAFDAFEANLHAFAQAPTEAGLRSLDSACTRLPVREKVSGQVGEGHPGERDAKFRCMLEFLTVMDQSVRDDVGIACLNVAVEGVPIAGMNPGDVKDPVVREKYIAAIEANNVVMEQRNFQARLQIMRKRYAVFRIPRFVEENYPRSERNQPLQEIIRTGLKSDPKAADLMASLLREAGAS